MVGQGLARSSHQTLAGKGVQAGCCTCGIGKGKGEGLVAVYMALDVEGGGGGGLVLHRLLHARGRAADCCLWYCTVAAKKSFRTVLSFCVFGTYIV